MRLSTFPIPTVEESFQSVVARHLCRSPGSRMHHLDRLGLRGMRAIAAAPNRICSLTSVLPVGHPWSDAPELVMSRHTLAPLYLHFAEASLASSTMELICSGRSSNVSATLGITVRMRQEGARGHKFCPECVANDVAFRGFAVGYRAHQPDFVRVCATHRRPLQWSCRRCSSHLASTAFASWEMAGRCACDAPDTPAAYDASLDVRTAQGLDWIAQQVNAILSFRSSRSANGSVASGLKDMLEGAGFSGKPNIGLDSIAIKSALVDRYGTSLFDALGAAKLIEHDSSRWPSRLLSGNSLNGQRIPDVLGALLLVGLVAESITELWEFVDKPLAKNLAEPATPKGYGVRIAKDRRMLVREDIEAALVLANGRLSAAATALSVSSSVLATNMLHLAMSCPLSDQAIKRMGAVRIEQARAALRSGIPKLQIMSDLGLGEWSLTLIELDDVSLRGQHRGATVSAQRERHRVALMNYLCEHPEATRSTVSTECVSVVDWLRHFDREWLYKQLPERKVVKQSAKPLRLDWAVLDEEMIEAVTKFVQQELESSKRPTWLSPTCLLKAVQRLIGKPPWKKDRTPGVWRAVADQAESREDFIRRKIRWAMQLHAINHEPVSMNTFRRTVALAPFVLIANSDFVQRCALELELVIDARCCLSPLRSTVAERSYAV